MKNKKIAIAFGSLTIASLLGFNSVLAGTTWSAQESPALPGANGSVTSSVQTKTTNNDAGLRMHATQGYEIDVRSEGTTTSIDGAWYRNVLGGNTYTISAPQAINTKLQLRFSSNWNSPSTKLVFNWRSN